MDTGSHVMIQEKESVYDTIRGQWASVTTSVKGQTQKSISIDYQSILTISGCQGIPGQTQLGWPLKKTKSNVRISPAVKQFLTNVFEKVNKDGKQKANPTEIPEEIKEKFKRDEWLETQPVKGFFSRLAATHRGQEIGGQQDHDQDLALERKVFLQHLEQQVNGEVTLDNPVEYETLTCVTCTIRADFNNFSRS